MKTTDIKTTTQSNAVVNHFFNLNCIVTNHAAPAAVQNDEQALEYYWREIFCKQRKHHFFYLVTPQGNVYLLNPCLLHHYFDNGNIKYQKLEKSLFVGEYQLMKSLPYRYTGLVNVLNLCGVYPA